MTPQIHISRTNYVVTSVSYSATRDMYSGVWCFESRDSPTSELLSCTVIRSYVSIISLKF